MHGELSTTLLLACLLTSFRPPSNDEERSPDSSYQRRELRSIINKYSCEKGEAEKIFPLLLETTVFVDKRLIIHSLPSF